MSKFDIAKLVVGITLILGSYVIEYRMKKELSSLMAKLFTPDTALEK